MTTATVIDTPQGIRTAQFMARKGALKLELAGMTRHGRTAYSIIKSEYHLHGSREKVLAAMQRAANRILNNHACAEEALDPERREGFKSYLAKITEPGAPFKLTGKDRDTMTECRGRNPEEAAVDCLRQQGMQQYDGKTITVNVGAGSDRLNLATIWHAFGMKVGRAA